LTAILDSGATFQNQADVIKLLRTGSAEENVTKWCGERMSLILTSLNKMELSADDAPALLSVIADKGLAVLTDVSVYLFASSPFVTLPLSLAFYHNLGRNPPEMLPSIFG
jgi:hypothetical protein